MTLERTHYWNTVYIYLFCFYIFNDVMIMGKI